MTGTEGFISHLRQCVVFEITMAKARRVLGHGGSRGALLGGFVLSRTVEEQWRSKGLSKAVAMTVHGRTSEWWCRDMTRLGRTLTGTFIS